MCDKAAFRDPEWENFQAYIKWCNAAEEQARREGAFQEEYIR